MRFSTMPESAPKIRVLVADDEPLARRGVRQLLARHADMVVVGESRNGPETLRALVALAPDLLFLDVQMPEMDGFEVLRARGADRMPAVVFVTAHDQFAVRAFEAHALDYLVEATACGAIRSSAAACPRAFATGRGCGPRGAVGGVAGRGKGRARKVRRRPAGGSDRDGRTGYPSGGH